MSADKQQNEDRDLFQSHWHKCPNILTDRLVGEFISPNAAWIVVGIWRLTEGMNGRSEASIPTERFMRLLSIKKKETVYKFVQEAVDSGLITVKKQRGIVNVYSINKSCALWAIEDEVATEIEVTPKLGSTEKGDYLVPKKGTRVVPKIGTGVVPKKGTLIKKEENIKENIKDSANNHEEPVKKIKSLNIPFEVFWKTYAKSVAKDKCEAKWSALSNKVREEIMQHLPAYVASKPVKKFRKDPHTYLNGKGWLDEIITDEPRANQQAVPSYRSMSVNAKYDDPNHDPLGGLGNRIGATNEKR